MEDSQSDLQQGMLEFLTLKTLALESMHGWGIARRIQQVSRQVFQINQGSLYPALHRLEMEDSSTPNGVNPSTTGTPSPIASRQEGADSSPPR